MDANDKIFYKKLFETFKVEAGEHLKIISHRINSIEHENNSENIFKFVENIYHELHSLKGAARTVNLSDIEIICQTLESLVILIKKDLSVICNNNINIVLNDSINICEDIIKSPERIKINQISEVVDTIEKLEEEIKEQIKNKNSKENNVEQKNIEINNQSNEEIVEKDQIESNKNIDNNNYDINIKNTTMINKTKNIYTNDVDQYSDTIRIKTNRLDQLLLQAEEMLSVKLNAEQNYKDLDEMFNLINEWMKKWNKLLPTYNKFKKNIKNSKHKNETDKISKKITNHLDLAIPQIERLEDRLKYLLYKSVNNYQNTSRKVDNLLEDTKKVLMFPFSTILESFPKMIRDISSDQNKKISLKIIGENIEVDKRILEVLKDPLVHIVRNCIDHGIELPVQRKNNKKTENGKIIIKIKQLEANKVEISIKDDGKGIDIKEIKFKAIEQKFISKDELDNYDDNQVLNLIFKSEFSTSPIVTDISGRGLGLAIVKEKIEQLGGKIGIKTKINKGITINLIIPVTLSTMRGVIIKSSNKKFIIPTLYIERVLRYNKNDIKRVENKETIVINDNPLSIIHLSDVLGLPKIKTENNNYQVVVVKLAEIRIAYIVDKIMYEQEILSKQMGSQLKRVKNISGASIVGSGVIIPIINVFDIVKSTINNISETSSIPLIKATKEIKKQKKIIVVEDSITSRMLIKNILESAGYKVKTAIDGIDAYTQIKTEKFDIIVSDVDMPRMNGLELTKKIREENKSSELPIILITALEKKEDKERGIDVGANAYIIKSSFEQSNLLNTVNRFI